MAAPISIVQPVASPLPPTARHPARPSDSARGAPAGASADPSLAMLEAIAGQVAESTGEPCTASPTTPPGDTDPSYRVELMGFIVGSLSRAVQALRGPRAEPAAAAPEEQDVPDEEVAAELAAELAAAEEVTEEVVQPALPAAVGDGAPDLGSSAYGQDGQPRAADPAPRIDRWA